MSTQDSQRGLMVFKAALSTEADIQAAVSEIRAAIAGIEPDLALLFVSHHHGPEFDGLLADVREAINPRNLIGCTGDGIIGPDREVERSPALAIWTAKLPGVRALPFLVDQNDVMRLDGSEEWREHLGVNASDGVGFIVLPEPFSIDAERCIGEMDRAYEGSKIVGGMASGGRRPGENRLFLNDQVLRQGMVGVSLAGAISIETVVSQGCRPIGEPFVVTKAKENIIYELRGRPVLEVVRGVYTEASPPDQALMQQGLHLGQVIDERLGRFGPGDFLIRNLGRVPGEEGLAVAALIRPGQTIRFHVRDSRTADEEMRGLLAGRVGEMAKPPRGGLLFSCNGRGTGMFGVPHHDIGVVNSVAKDCQVAGFFAAGEIGPIGNRTFIHGLTSSLILFQEPG